MLLGSPSLIMRHTRIRIVNICNQRCISIDGACRLGHVLEVLREHLKTHVLMRGDNSSLSERPFFRKVFEAAALKALSNTPVNQHHIVAPGASDRCPLSWSMLQAHGFVSLQPVGPELYRVIMSPAILDIWLRHCAGEGASPHVISQTMSAL